MKTVTLTRKSGIQWSPTEGEALRRLGDHLLDTGFLKTESDFEPVRHSALQILSLCHPFSAPDGRRTGLVVGYVQSGKTLSMSSVASAAADNGCRLVIVLAGTKRNLLTQSAGRFKKDLRGAGKYSDTWVMLDTTETIDSGRASRTLADCLEEWNEPDDPDELDKTPLFWTVMKHHSHLAAVQESLEHLDLRGIPALIIDDEADQAGLNTQPDEDDTSTTFAAIEALRKCLPHHSYLQYTATPQAPLLISLTDLLSPDFAEVLTPGKGYTGGQVFFIHQSPYVQRIPQEDLFSPGSPPDSPPASLLEALKVFFVGTAISYIQNRSIKRSMLIHPSRLTADHTCFVSFVNAAKGNWKSILKTSKSDPDRAELVGELKGIYRNLTERLEVVPTFDETFLKHLVRLLGRRSQVHEVNGNTGEVDWSNGSAHILVGGEKLNRGYTVENLSVTWMPRDAGGWNADTIQQRARFFGYKQSYIELCRVYLHPDVYHAFKDYVDHEQSIRKQLIAHQGQPLDNWKRAFLMDKRLKPTRKTVLSDPYYRFKGGNWFKQKTPHGIEQEAASNTALVNDLKKSVVYKKHPEFPMHEVAIVSLKMVYESLVINWRVHGHSDIVAFFAIRCWIMDLLEEDEKAQCYLISIKAGKTRNRSLTKTGSVSLFEGRRSSGTRYPGDGNIRNTEMVTLQIHTIQIKNSAQGPIHAIAVHVPASLCASDVVAQPSAHQ